MKKLLILTLTLAGMAGLILTARGSDDAEQFEFPQITAQPTDQGTFEGGAATFSVQATNGALSYQWLCNGAVLEGQTNSSLMLENVGTNDVGLYSCNVSRDLETVPTRAASLSVSALVGDTIVVFGTPIASGGSQNPCPGSYAGYVNFTKTVAQGWGYAPNGTIHTATDTTRSDTKVSYWGKLGDRGCDQTTVTVPHPTYSTKYRFAIYFPNNVPTGTYSISLQGFDP